ncbi:ABC transporter permease [Frankia sp. R43]|uniref:ABC transporter permease n=1 Tax=Frankia sp. R43 TaxID=269536 RepID=UPI000AA20FCD|nr:ABC transporter permease [Frankia sp. R43]
MNAISVRAQSQGHSPAQGRGRGRGRTWPRFRTRPGSPLGRRAWMAVPPVLVAGLILAVWYSVSYLALDASRRFLMPPPHTVATVAFGDAKVRADIATALWRTAQVAFTGLAAALVLGVLWAVVMNHADWLERSLFPYAVMLQCIPVLALVPLIGFWFGFDFFARVIVCVLIALFPIVSNTMFGLRSVEQAQRELFALQRASRWVVLTRLELRAALPAIFAGTRISAGLAVVGAIVADFFFRQGDPGIGALISRYQARAQSPELFASVLVASALGAAVFVGFGWMSRRCVGRWYHGA